MYYLTRFVFVSFRYLTHRDSITVSVWNHKKIHKKQGAGFLGCVRIVSNSIQRLKDTGCKHTALVVCKLCFLFIDQFDLIAVK
jgi:hypothetical protein